MAERLSDYVAAHQVKLATAFLRYVALIAANAGQRRGGIMKAAQDAETFAATTPNVIRLLQAAARGQIDLRDPEQFIKAPVAAGTLTDSTWAQPLLDHAAIMAQFLEVLRPQTILGRLTTRPVPFNQYGMQQTAGVTASWVGEGLPIPLDDAAFIATRLDPKKLAVIVATSRDLARFGDPVALAAFQRDLVRAVGEASDRSFIDPSLGATSARPASITHGVTPRHSTGSTIAQITADLEAAADSLIALGSSLTTASWIIHPHTALHLSALRGTTGGPVFPNVTVLGGTLLGLPVIVSAAAAPSGSPGEYSIVLADGDRIMVADAGIVVDASENAALQLDSAPAAGAQSMTSLWQSNLVATRIQRIVNWYAFADAVALIDNITF